MPTEVEDLVARAMIGLDDDLNSSDDLRGWNAIVHLHRLPNREVLDAAISACSDADSTKRRVGAAILGQLGHIKVGFEPVFIEERYLGLTKLLNAEREGAANTAVLNDVCVALGHLHDQRAIPAVLELMNHPSADVRYGVVFGLLNHNTQEAINGLIVLSSDPSEAVRDWATMGLGVSECDITAVRAALHARLDDPSPNVRNGAIEGLAMRGDRSVIPALIKELFSGAALPLLDAATVLASPELCEALVASATKGLTVKALIGPFDLTKIWDEAMRACGCQTEISNK